MGHFFFEKYSIKSKLSSQQVFDRIINNTDELDHFRMEFLSDNVKEYESKVSANSFEVRKIGSYRTSLLVFAKGTIEEHESGTTIKIKMRPSLSAILFHSFWFGFVIFFSILVLLLSLKRDLKGLLFLIIPAIMLFSASRNISFRQESNRLKEFLTNLFDNGNQ